MAADNEVNKDEISTGTKKKSTVQTRKRGTTSKKKATTTNKKKSTSTRRSSTSKSAGTKTKKSQDRGNSLFYDVLIITILIMTCLTTCVSIATNYHVDQLANNVHMNSEKLVNEAQHSTSDVHSINTEELANSIDYDTLANKITENILSIDLNDNTVEYSEDNTVEYSEDKRVKLGVKVANCTEYNEPVDGAYVIDVISGSPADIAGIKPGMTIIGVDQYEVHSIYDLTDNLYKCNYGDVAIITFEDAKGNIGVIPITLGS